MTAAAVDRFLARWRRRYWREDRTVTAAFDGLQPVVVITGASEGIGRALARCCAGRGDGVVLVARGADRLAAVAAELGADTSARVSVLALDVTALDADATIAAHVASRGGYVDILINCAGVGLGGPLLSQPVVSIDALVALNVAALTRLTRAMLPDMVARGRGGIINVASLGGYGPGPHQAAYYASKAYVLSLTEAIAHEVRGQGVRVMAVAPGPVETAFHAKMSADGAAYRWLLPALSASRVADATLRGFRYGRRVVWPGLIAPVLAVSLRVLPHPASVPFVGLLLRRPANGSERGSRD